MNKNEITVEVDASNFAREFLEVVQRAYKEKPDKKDIAELRKWLDSNPALWRGIFDLSEAIQGEFVNRMTSQKPAQIAIDANISEIKQEMGYLKSSILEKLLIENIISTWLNYQWLNYQIVTFMGKSGVRFTEIEFWEKRLSISQNRYLRACEALAKVRRLMSVQPLVQVNIAKDNGQQVNVAGDFVSDGGSKNQES